MVDGSAGTNAQGESPDVEPVVETDEATLTEDAELERTLGLTGGLAIGIGTIIGAGILVFPGLAGGRIGTAATVSLRCWSRCRPPSWRRRCRKAAADTTSSRADSGRLRAL